MPLFKTSLELVGTVWRLLFGSNSPIGIPFVVFLMWCFGLVSGMIGAPPEVIDVVSALIISLSVLTILLDIGFALVKIMKAKGGQTNMDFITL
ncbi:MAG: hypothetical protein ACLS36_03200 [Streptococcus sp.]